MKEVLTDNRTSSLIHTITDGMGLPVIFTDSDCNITEINGSALQLFQYKRQEIQGVNINILYRDSSFLERIRHMRGGSSRFKLYCISKDREVFPSETTVLKTDEGYIFVVKNIKEILKIQYRAELRTREIQTFSALSEILSRGKELKEILNDVLDTLIDGLRIDAAWLYLIDEKSANVRLCCYRDTSFGSYSEDVDLTVYEPFLCRVISSGKALVVSDSIDDPRISLIPSKGKGFKSLVGLPLTVKEIESETDKIVGVLGVASLRTSRFSPMDVKFLKSIANQLGFAIENSRLIENLKKKMNQIELINEIGSVVNSSLSIGHIFRLIVSEIKSLIEFDRASITLLNEDEATLTIFALDTVLETELKKGRRAPVRGTSAGWAAINQRPWINRDLAREILFPVDSVLYREGIRSTISVPLYKDRPLGSINFDSTKPDAYTEADLEILIPIAKHLSIAIENALLFEAISREKREWEKTFDAITDLLWITDLKGRIIRANRAVTERTGLSEITLKGKDTLALFSLLRIQSPSLPEVHRTSVKIYRELKGKQGTTYYYWTYPLKDSDGREYGYINYLRDVTEQKNLQEQLIRSDKLASLGTLVAGIAHEINNPLGIIAGYSEALLERLREAEAGESPSLEDFPEYLQTINKEIFRCKDILQSLLDFARPSTGTKRLIDINELIKEVLLLVEHKARKHRHTIKLDLASPIPHTRVDPGAMRQVFMNIIMNAFYFMEEEGTILIRTSFDHEHDLIVIGISDSGRGIKRELLKRIFDPFFTTKPVGKGTGLGLSISHRIVTEHDGVLDVESTEGRGTTFVIKLPVRK